MHRRAKARPSTRRRKAAGPSAHLPATRERLLDVAAQQFAARGFKRVTIRDVCRTADANVAAINYHFGDKQNLYREVLERAIALMRDVTESSRREGADLPPADRLRVYIRIFVGHLLGRDTATWLHRLMMREHTDPTPAFDDIVDRGVRPRLEHVADIVAAIAGLPASDERIVRAVASIQAQCIMAVPTRMSARLNPGFAWTPPEIEKLVHHVAEFSLAGIRALAAAAPDWGSADLDDDAFLRQIEAGRFPAERFRHADHVRLAWIYVRRDDPVTAEAKMVHSIRAFAARVHKPEKYHDTMTRAWLRLVATATVSSPHVTEFAHFKQAHEWLFERGALAGFYSDAVLMSPAAREHWLEPDLHVLPG